MNHMHQTPQFTRAEVVAETSGLLPGLLANSVTAWHDHLERTRSEPFLHDLEQIIDLRHNMNSIFIAESVAQNTDVYFQYGGRSIADHLGVELTGEYLSSLDIGDGTRDYFMRCVYSVVHLLTPQIVAGTFEVQDGPMRTRQVSFRCAYLPFRRKHDRNPKLIGVIEFDD